jgi:DNA-binding transcriptional LysR family regulator
VSLTELEREPFIFREETSGTQQSLQGFLAKAGLDLRKWVPNLVLDTTEAVVSAVEIRAGIAFVSNLAIKKSLGLGLVKQVNVNGLRLTRDFYCIYRRERMVSRLLEEFITFIRARSP